MTINVHQTFTDFIKKVMNTIWTCHSDKCYCILWKATGKILKVNLIYHLWLRRSSFFFVFEDYSFLNYCISTKLSENIWWIDIHIFICLHAMYSLWSQTLEKWSNISEIVLSITYEFPLSKLELDVIKICIL